MVVVTHTVPEEWADREGSPFTFVTDGVPAAIDVAREIAGGKDVVVVLPASPSSACSSGCWMPSISTWRRLAPGHQGCRSSAALSEPSM
jgi:hypothetical protein